MGNNRGVFDAPLPSTERTIGAGSFEILGVRYPMFIRKRPATCTIYNVPTTTADWTAIATGLTKVRAWKLNERAGNDYLYCYDGVGTTYMTSLGVSIEQDTEITAIYVKRTGAANVTMELEVWTD